MKILVFGATGPTGLQVVTQALSQGHDVTAFSRRPDPWPTTHARLRIVVGDTTRDSSAVAQAMQGQDVVVSALGRGKTFKSDNLMVLSMRCILPAMQSARVRRLIVMSAFGVGESQLNAPLIPRIMYRMLLREMFADKEAAEEEVRWSRLDWTIVYPVLLTNGPMTGRYRVGERLKLRGIPRISRADVAHFIMSEVHKRAYIRKVPIISY